MRNSRVTRLFIGILAGSMATFAVPVAAGASVNVKQQWQLHGTATGDLFGFTTAMQGDTLVVGDQGHGANAGAVFIYSKVHSTWVKEATLLGSLGDGFGNAVALDGSTLVVGAQGQNGARGAVCLAPVAAASALTGAGTDRAEE